MKPGTLVVFVDPIALYASPYVGSKFLRPSVRTDDVAIFINDVTGPPNEFLSNASYVLFKGIIGVTSKFFIKEIGS